MISTLENTIVSSEKPLFGGKRYVIPKGTSGNPGGRPKGLASLVRAKTNDGKSLVNLMLKIVEGKLAIDGIKPNHRDRIAAAEWLADRGFGKAANLNVNLNEEVNSPAAIALELARLRMKDQGVIEIQEVEQSAANQVLEAKEPCLTHS